MKVIKKGRQQKGWAKEKECTGAGNNDGGCGAILLVELGDLFQTSSSCRDETDYFVTFECPECHVLTDIDDASCRPHSLPRKSPRNRTDDNNPR